MISSLPPPASSSSLLSQQQHSPCSPVKRLRTSISIERSPEQRFEQLKFLQFAVSNAEKQRERAAMDLRAEEEEEENANNENAFEIETDQGASQQEAEMMEERIQEENRAVPENVLRERSINCEQQQQPSMVKRPAAKSIASLLKSAISESGDFDLADENNAEVAEILDVFVSIGVLEKTGTRYAQKKAVALPALPSTFAPVQPNGHKAYYNHPQGNIEQCDLGTSIAMNLASRAALGTLGSTIHQQFLPPCPEDMHFYQTKCLENFMKRYNDFYRVVTQHASKLN